VLRLLLVAHSSDRPLCRVCISTIHLFDLKPLAKLQNLYSDVPLSETFMALFLEATSTHNLTDLTISMDPSRSGEPSPRSLHTILNRLHFETRGGITSIESRIFFSIWCRGCTHGRSTFQALSHHLQDIPSFSFTMRTISTMN